MPSYADGYRPLPGNNDWKPRETATSTYFEQAQPAEKLQILKRAADRAVSSAVTARRAAEQAEEAAAEIAHMIGVLQAAFEAREGVW